MNLALHVTGRREDGRHDLDSLVCFAETGDVLAGEPDDALTLTVDGPEADGVPVEGNLVLRAARMLDPERGARITLTKHLPAAAGIGGGSSDAAAALRLLSRLWNVPMPNAAETDALGSDVPVCLDPRPVRMRGAGERLDPVTLPPFAVVLVNPRAAVPTGSVFAGVERRDGAELEALPEGGFAALCAWLARQRNDLAAPAVRIAPVIGTVLDALSDAPAHGMSGSGATCWALFEGLAEAASAAERLRAAHPDWWVAASLASHATRSTT